MTTSPTAHNGLNGTHRQIDWGNPDLSLLSDSCSPPPVFPTELLGSFWAEWCAETAAAANAPVDYVAASLLTVAGALLGNARKAKVGAWTEPPVLWCVLVGPPSSKKSPAVDSLMGMVARLEKRHGDAERIYIGDATPLGSAKIAAGSPKGLLLFRDELAAWWKAMRQQGGDAYWLNAFGARHHIYDRGEKPSLNIERLAISVLGGTQPDRVREVIEAKTNTGFVQRLMFVNPAPRSGFKLCEAANDALAEQALARLCDLSASNGPRPCLLAQTAKAHLKDWVEAIEADAADGEGLFAEWLGKQTGVALRVALIVEHLRWAAETPMAEAPPDEVSEVTYRKATYFVDAYLRPMAERTFGLASRAPEEIGAAKLARLLRKSRVDHFDSREVRRNALGPVGGLADAKAMGAACDVLESVHLIRATATRAGTTKGRCASNYEVNPAIFTAGDSPGPVPPATGRDKRA